MFTRYLNDLARKKSLLAIIHWNVILLNYNGEKLKARTSSTHNRQNEMWASSSRGKANHTEEHTRHIAMPGDNSLQPHTHVHREREREREREGKRGGQRERERETHACMHARLHVNCDGWIRTAYRSFQLHAVIRLLSFH